MTTSSQHDPNLSAKFAEWGSMEDQFAKHLQELEEVINRSERDGLCSVEVAQAAREMLGSCRKEMQSAFVATCCIHVEFSGGSVADLLTREQMLLRLNELGYPLTASHLKKVWGPLTERWGRAELYRLDDAVAWAKSHFGSARAVVVT
jgi:hypothetical protein